MIAADAAGGDDDGLGAQLEAADGTAAGRRTAAGGIRLQHGPERAGDLVAVEQEAVDLMPEGEARQT